MTPQQRADQCLAVWQLQRLAGIPPEDRQLPTPANDRDSFESDQASVAQIMAQRPQIVVDQDVYAPPEYRWTATEGDYDIGCTVGSGKTPLDAIVDLLDQIEGGAQ